MRKAMMSIIRSSLSDFQWPPRGGALPDSPMHRGATSPYCTSSACLGCNGSTTLILLIKPYVPIFSEPLRGRHPQAAKAQIPAVTGKTPYAGVQRCRLGRKRCRTLTAGEFSRNTRHRNPKEFL